MICYCKNVIRLATKTSKTLPGYALTCLTCFERNRKKNFKKDKTRNLTDWFLLTNEGKTKLKSVLHCPITHAALSIRKPKL